MPGTTIWLFLLIPSLPYLDLICDVSGKWNSKTSIASYRAKLCCPYMFPSTWKLISYDAETTHIKGHADSSQQNKQGLPKYVGRNSTSIFLAWPYECGRGLSPVACPHPSFSPSLPLTLGVLSKSKLFFPTLSSCSASSLVSSVPSPVPPSVSLLSVSCYISYCWIRKPVPETSNPTL